VKLRIEVGLSAYAGRFVAVPVPNIANVFYGRDVGYAIERIVLDESIEALCHALALFECCIVISIRLLCSAAQFLHFR
jgi:hypothetical protein